MHSLKIDEVLKRVKSTGQGLTVSEAKKRLKENGRNEIEKPKKQSFLKCFFKQFLNIMVGILLISAVVSIVLAVIKKEYTDLFDGCVILFIVFMNALIGVFQEYKAQACIDELKKYNIINVTTIRNGVRTRVESEELVVGDIVKMKAGEIVSADVRLISTNNFSCDESSLTGESVASLKEANVVLKETCPLAERCNMAYSGSLITGGNALGVVVATGKQTEIGKIANLITKAKKEITPLQKSINKIGKIITWTVVAVSLAVMLAELISGSSVEDSLMISVALAVAAIPESLPAVITIIMALGVQQLAKRRCVIKHLHAVETLGSCEIICSDKTGTITQNKMKVTSIVEGDKLVDKITDVSFLDCVKNCTNVKMENGVLIGEPTEKAIIETVVHSNIKSKRKVYENPFSSQRKMMSVVVEDNSNFVLFAKGAPENLIKKCKFIKIDGKIYDFNDYFKEKIKKINENMADSALRVVAFCEKNLGNEVIDFKNEAEQDMVFLGLMGMIDNPKPEVEKSIQACFNAGLTPVMITGDHKRTAFAIAKKVGIATNISQVITGEELDKLSDKEFKSTCLNYRVYARVSPEHKVRIVTTLKQKNKIVAMTGDGVNDAPSLKVADIGVGMGVSGTDVVKSVSDMLVTDDNFSSIVIAVEQGRKVYNNIQKALQFLISTNCVEVFGMLIALLAFPGHTFLLPAQMLFVNLVTDSLPALALGMEPVEQEIMKSPPRNPKAGLFSGKIGAGIIYQSIVQTFIVLAVFVVGVFCYESEIASTMVFFTIIFMQLLHSVNCKSNNSIFEINILKNKTFNICFLITLALNLSVACIPFMYKLFSLKFLNISQWIVVAIASILIIPLCELFKAIINNKEYKITKNSKN